MGRYAIITDPLAGMPKVLMVCNTRGEADAILVDLRRHGNQVEVHELAPAGLAPRAANDTADAGAMNTA